MKIKTRNKFPNKKYNIIYADPPWEYKDKALSGNRGACCKYDVQNSNWISNLPINNISDKNCILFLWCTMPQLNIVFNIIQSWGFDYKTVAFTWIKTYKNNSLFWGMGGWTRSNPELCLLCTKGKPQRVSKKVHSVVMSKIEQHSKKPNIVRNKIIELCGDLPRIELFARERYIGWDSWGNQISNDKPIDSNDLGIKKYIVGK